MPQALEYVLESRYELLSRTDILKLLLVQIDFVILNLILTKLFQLLIASVRLVNVFPELLEDVADK